MLLVRTVALSELHEDPRNARIHNDRNLAAIHDSIEEFGQYSPIVVQKGTGLIIAGNGRYRVMKKMGAETIDIVEVDVTDEQAKRMALTDNRTAELAEWDLDALVELFGEIDTENDPVPGWTHDELENMFAPISSKLKEKDDMDLDAFDEEENDRCTCPRCGYSFKA